MSRSRRTWLIAGLGLLLMLALLLPEQAILFAGAAAGWALAVTYLFRSRERMQYQKAIRHMRRGEYEQGIRIMDSLIDEGPDSLDYRQIRAQLYRLSSDLQRAAADYEWMVARGLGAVPACIGLAEINIRQGDYDQAREHARAALNRDANNWAAAYDLGLIEDRQGSADAAVTALEAALKAGIPHSRFRLLARLWLARSYHRLGRDDDAEKQIALLRREKKGLREWQTILESDQGAVLRDLLEYDVQLAQELVESEGTLAALD